MRNASLLRRWRDWSADQCTTTAPFVLAAGVAISVAVHPSFVLTTNEGGVSDYGAHLATVIPYATGFSLAAVLYRRSAHLLRVARANHTLERLLRTYAIILLLTFTTSFGYTLDPC